MPDHILGDGDVVVDFSVVHLEFQTNEVGEDGCGAGFCADGAGGLAWFGAGDGEAVIV